jgi:acyl-CoA reductase-like NAD-dependent aldehyde dehydrogenase
MNVSQADDFLFLNMQLANTRAIATFPIGGVKGSGWGRNNAIWGLQEFSETKLMTWSMEGHRFI